MCKALSLNRSGYYKWRQRLGKPNRYTQDRIDLTALLEETHAEHKAFGYHALAKCIREETGWVFSDNLAHKCCKAAGIKSMAKHYRYRKPGNESIFYPNLVHGNWAANEPLRVVVSDMTCIRNKGKLYEWTLFVDTFNNEIIAHSLSGQRGDSKPYFACLERLCSMIDKKKEQAPQTVLHTDQGSVYSSRAFALAHKHYNIIRSMSRAGTPTDNPIIESLNGWMKAELALDFNVSKAEDISKTLDEYVHYFNYERHASALNYKTPIQFKTESGF